MTKNQEIKISSSSHDLFDVAAKDFILRAVSAVDDKGLFSVLLSVVNTPKLFFDLLTIVVY